MNVKISRLYRGYYSSKGWKPAVLIANCEGHRVKCVGNGRGWDCACPDPDCAHLNAVAAVIAPELLEELELESDHHLRRERWHPQTPAKPGRKRVSA